MEILQKLVAVALVAIVSKTEGAMMPLAVTLLMAATSAIAQPYAQPQALAVRRNRDMSIESLWSIYG